MKDLEQTNMGSPIPDYTIEQAIQLIRRESCFAGYVNHRSFYLRIDDYRPLVCTAIHNGHHLRPELMKNCLLTPEERFYEEDPYTDELISSFPIVLVGNDSRFEYDLNRPKTQSTYYKSAWEKQVWNRKLTTKQRSQSHEKHHGFYQVLEAIITQLESLYKSCLIFDLHSYNYQRHPQDTPTFNIGTAQIDLERWSDTVLHFQKQLNKIRLPNLEVRSAINELFAGRGYLIAHINAHFDNTLVIPTEAKKVFMNELTGELYPLVLDGLKAGIKEAVTQTAAHFARKYSKKVSVNKANMLSSQIDPAILNIDYQLYQICQHLDILSYISPLNFGAEKRKFFERKEKHVPNFRYKQLDFDPYEIRRDLYHLPLDQIRDVGFHQLYRSVIDSLAHQTDLLTTVGTEDFVYNSLRFYGKPDRSLIKSAIFILSAPDFEDHEEESIHDAEYAVNYLRRQAEEWGLKCTVETSKKIVARMMFHHERLLLLINQNTHFSDQELKALAYHQLGVNVHTTINASTQPLKVFSIGFPEHHRTQAGLVIFSEYCSGNLTLSRLKNLALRVIAIKHMLHYGDFLKTYHMLLDEYQATPEQSFSVTVRVFRGGGFTKDFHYLVGLKALFNSAKMQNVTPLLAGNTDLTFLPIIHEMLERKLIKMPTSFFPLTGPTSTKNQIADYLLSAICS